VCVWGGDISACYAAIIGVHYLTPEMVVKEFLLFPRANPTLNPNT
jgi:hypothetical protein